MTTYSLEHLTQPDQKVFGPIQDDEALFLYALIKLNLIKTVFEIGGLNGYSTTNFMQAVGPEGKVFTADINASGATTRGSNHKGINKDCKEVNAEDLENNKIDLIFFDCHVYDAQLQTLENFFRMEIVDDSTLVAIHDTGLHPVEIAALGGCGYYNTVTENGVKGVVHQPDERRLVNTLVSQWGYSPLCLHPPFSRFTETGAVKCRHGLTILSKFKQLEI